MQLARSEELAGVDLVAVVVDPVERNRAMVDKLGLGFPILSDPDGQGLIRPLGVWNDDRGIARPATFVVAPDGTIAWSRIGAHAADRPVGRDIADALEEMEER